MTDSQERRPDVDRGLDPTPSIAPVVVGVDGSKPSALALSWACEHARGGARDVLAACVRTLPPLPDELMVGASPCDELADTDDPDAPVRSIFDAMAEQAEADFPGLTILRRVLHGNPAEELIRLSQTTDLIVVGARGHGAFTGMLMGSVSQHLVSHSQCTVVIVR